MSHYIKTLDHARSEILRRTRVNTNVKSPKREYLIGRRSGLLTALRLLDEVSKVGKARSS